MSSNLQHAPIETQPPWWAASVRCWNAVSNRLWLSMLTVCALTLVTRAALLPWQPIPQPMITDEFSHLLVADTFASGRMVNPAHPFWEHFETIYEFQRPVHASKYPPGLGLTMAIGQVLGGHPWWGIWGATGLMCAAGVWMAAGWVEPGWALAAGLLCVFHIGIFSYWMNSYMGGSTVAIGGALALGALPRLMRTGRATLAVVFALGLAIVFSIRPYEGALFIGACGAILSAWFLTTKAIPLSTRIRSVLVPIACVAVLAGGALAYYNFRVTGSPLVTPYQLSQQMYGVPRVLPFQKRPPTPAFRFQDQRQVYEWQYRTNIGKRRKIQMFYEFYLGAPLAVALIFLLLAWRKPAVYQLGFVCAVLAAGAGLYWYFLPHYLAALTAASFALAVLGLRELWNWKVVHPFLRRSAVAAIIMLDIVMNVHGGYQAVAVGPGGKPYRDFSETRFGFEQQLHRMGSKHLVFIRTRPKHFYGYEWVYNRANIDASEIVWAREIDPEEDARLVKYFGDRSVWVAEVDEKPFRYSKWPVAPSAANP